MLWDWAQILLSRADKDYPGPEKAPLRFIRSCSSALAPATLEKVEAAFHAPVLEVHPRAADPVAAAPYCGAKRHLAFCWRQDNPGGPVMLRCSIIKHEALVR